MLLNHFLAGEEITTGFLLKVFAALVIAGIIFGYYLSDLRYHGMRSIKGYFALGGGVVILAAIVFGFTVFGSPATQRALRFDGERVGDLQQIQSYLIADWQAKSTVPEALADLTDPTRGVEVPLDPKTQASYGYERLSPVSFKLCANFERESRGAVSEYYYPTKVMYDSVNGTPFVNGESWEHGVGTTCFERTIDPSYFPKTTTILR